MIKTGWSGEAAGGRKYIFSEGHSNFTDSLPLENDSNIGSYDADKWGWRYAPRVTSCNAP